MTEASKPCEKGSKIPATQSCFFLCSRFHNKSLWRGRAGRSTRARWWLPLSVPLPLSSLPCLCGDRTGGTSLQARRFPRAHGSSSRVLPGVWHVRGLCPLPAALLPPASRGHRAGHRAPAALPAPCPHSPAAAPLLLAISVTEYGPPGPLFAAPGKGARHRGRSGCGPVPSLGHSLRESLESPLFPCTATSLACGESLGDPTGPPSRRSCLLSLGSASRHGAHSGWWGPTWGVPVSPPTARAGAGAEQGAGADGPHVPQSPTRNYFLPAPHHAPHSRKHRVFTIRGSAGRRRPSRATDPAGCRVGRSPEAPASEPDAPAAASGCQAR